MPVAVAAAAANNVCTTVPFSIFIGYGPAMIEKQQAGTTYTVFVPITLEICRTSNDHPHPRQLNAPQYTFSSFIKKLLSVFILYFFTKYLFINPDYFFCC